jgi:hypothetical protein
MLLHTYAPTQPRTIVSRTHSIIIYICLALSRCEQPIPPYPQPSPILPNPSQLPPSHHCPSSLLPKLPRFSAPPPPLAACSCSCCYFWSCSCPPCSACSCSACFACSCALALSVHLVHFSSSSSSSLCSCSCSSGIHGAFLIGMQGRSRRRCQKKKPKKPKRKIILFNLVRIQGRNSQKVSLK